MSLLKTARAFTYYFCVEAFSKIDEKEEEREREREREESKKKKSATLKF